MNHRCVFQNLATQDRRGDVVDGIEWRWLVGYGAWSTTDAFVLSRAGNTVQFQFISKNGNLALRKFESALPLKLNSGRLMNTVTYKQRVPGTDRSLWYTSGFGEGKYRMRNHLSGFAFGEIDLQNGLVRGTVRIAPYWVSDSPLDPRSPAYLILTKLPQVDREENHGTQGERGIHESWVTSNRGEK